MSFTETQPKLHIYSASAGSGKTFTLTRYFLYLALQDPFEKPFRILAITFTNKATAEMRTRILKALTELADEKGSEHSRFLCDSLHIDESELTRRAQIALSEILHRFQHFHISTIDKFFQKILRSFAREIKRIGFETEIEEDDASDFMVQGLMEDITQNELLKNWMLQFARERIASKEVSWNFSNEIKAFASRLFSEKYKELKSKNQRSIPLEAFVDLKVNLTELMEQLESELNQIVQAAKTKLSKLPLDEMPQASRSPILANLMTKTEFPLSTPFYENLYQKAEAYFSKNESKLKPEHIAWLDVYKNDFVQACLNFCSENGKNYHTARLILNNLYTLALSTDLLKHLEAYRNEHNILLLSDSADFISIMTRDADSPFLYEKIGAKYDHFLLDEFQDTSSLQWSNMAPLIANSIDQGYENLIVGDAKQAIYRFRNGDKNLLQFKVNEQFAPLAQTHFLDTNYRSQQLIVQFNNSITLLATMVMQKIYDQENTSDFFKEELQRSVDLYKNSAQKHHKQNGGYVEMQYFPIPYKDKNEEGEDAEDENPEILFEQARLHILDALSRGYKQSDICVLSYKKEPLRNFAHFITLKNEDNKDPQIFTVSSETGMITRSAAVRCVIAAMRFAYNQNETIALTELIQGWYHLQNHPFHASLLMGYKQKENLMALLPTNFSFATLLNKPLLDMFYGIVEQFDLHNHKEHAPYLCALEDIIIQFTHKYKSGLADFLPYWNKNVEKFTLNASDETNGVKLMTIHKAKGLEFPIVICLMDNMSTQPSGFSNHIWVSREEGLSAPLGVLNIQVKSDLLESEFAQAYEKEMTEYINDGLNLFYVAVTRAEKELYLLSKLKLNKDGSVNKSSSISQHLYQAFFREKFYPVPKQDLFLDLTQYIDGDKLVLGQKEMYQSKDKAKAQNEVADFYFCNPNRPIKIKPARILTEKKEIRLGMLSHELLAMVKSQSDIDRTIQEWFMNGDITQNEMEDLKSLLGRLFTNTQVRQWFNTQAEVLTETPLISPNGSLKIPDRILLHADFNEVIDFKTGKAMSEHEKQIAEYAALLSEITNKPSRAYLFYLSDFSIKEVRHAE